MDLDLREISITIIVGAYLLFGLEVIVYLVFGSSTFSKLEKSTEFSTKALLGIAVVLCFAFGMLMEDISDKFVDRETKVQAFISSKFPLVKTDDDLKVETLYGAEALYGYGKLDRLAREMAERHLFCNYGGPSGREVEKAIDGSNPMGVHAVAFDVKSEAAKQLYYHAKNVVHLEDNYYDELKRIQVRIDFARSFFTMSLVLALSTVVLAAAKALRIIDRYRQRKKASDGEQLKGEALQLLAKTVCIISFFLLSCILGVFSYQTAERQFDLRAYGYFSSLHTRPDKAVTHFKQ